MSKVRETLRRIKPYFVVVHSGTGRSAVYDRQYRKMFEGASDRLLAYAVRYNTQVTPGFKLSYPEQQPTWMMPGMEEQCVGYHLYRDGFTTEQLWRIPEE